MHCTLQTIYAERRQNMNTTGNGVSPYHMTQLPHDMTQLAGDMTQIRHRPPPVYASDQRAADTARSRQHLAEMVCNYNTERLELCLTDVLTSDCPLLVQRSH